ncbi:MAG TPA: peptidase E [Solirubrobacterales bacterium]|jgi:peptidase E
MRRILCVGGHDFTSQPENRAMTDLIASMADGEEPRVCLLPTASGDAAEQSALFFTAFADRACVPSEVSLFRLGRKPVALRDHLLAQDLIYVGGGSMLNLLAVWDAHDLGAILRLAWERGILICGQSAGAMCWFEVGISKGSGKARRAAGLGVLPGSCCVHYHSEPDRRRLLLESVASGGISGYGIDDHAALLWTDRTVAGAFSARRGATVYRVERGADQVVEIPLAPSVVVPQAGDPAVPPEIAEFRRLRQAAYK